MIRQERYGNTKTYGKICQVNLCTAEWDKGHRLIVNRSIMGLVVYFGVKTIPEKCIFADSVSVLFLLVEAE